MIESLTKETEKHNQVIERTYKMESDLATSFKRLDEIRARVDRLEDHQARGL